MDASVLFITEDGKRREVPLKPRSYVIGRASDAGFRLPDGSLSRHHAELTFDGAGVSLKDLKSSNGTYVNGERLTTDSRPLSAGDAVLLGTTVLVICLDGQPDGGTLDLDAIRAKADPAAAPAAPAAAAAAGSPSESSDDGDASSLVAGLLDDLDDDGSSLGDFDFDFSDDDEDDDGQPSL